MSVSILGILGKGRTRVHERLNSNAQMQAIRNWVKEHRREIERAREGGYTWQEVTRACVESWKRNGLFKGVYIWKSETLISDCYYELKRPDKKGGTIRLSED